MAAWRLQVKRENDVIYYQRVPSEIPEQPAPKRLVTASAFVLPNPAPEALADALNTGPALPPASEPVTVMLCCTLLQACRMLCVSTAK